VIGLVIANDVEYFCEVPKDLHPTDQHRDRRDEGQGRRWMMDDGGGGGMVGNTLLYSHSHSGYNIIPQVGESDTV
jgi:hypothetical protein